MRLFVLFCLGFWAVPLLGAEPLASGGVRLEPLLKTAFEQNPDWQAAQAGVQRVRAQVEEAGGWEPANLKVQQFIEPIETRLGPQERVISLSQKIPFPGWSDQAERAARLQAQAAQLNLELKRRQLKREIKATYFDLWQYSAMPELLGQLQEVIERLAQMGSIESQRNQNLLDSIFEAQAKAGESAYQLKEMKDRLMDTQVRLNRLLGRGGEPLIQSVAAPKLPPFQQELAPLIQRALAEHPGIQAAQAQAQAGALNADLAASKAKAPSLELGINYFQIGPAANPSTVGSGQDAYNISLGISLPWGSGRSQGRAQAAREVAVVRSADAESWRQKVREQVALHYNHVVNAQRLVQLFETKILPPARRAGSINERLYSSGQRNIVAALKSKAQLLDLEVRYLKAQAAYLKSLSELEEWAGPLGE